MQVLRGAIQGRLNGMFGGALPPPSYQPYGTALAMAVAGDIGAVGGPRVLLAAPHDQETSTLLGQHGVGYEHREWLADFTVWDRSTPVEMPIRACESEVHPSHGVDYNFELWPGTNNPKNGYVWDFRKLLFVSAPSLLFVARVNKEQGDGGQFARLLRLKHTIAACATDYAAVWAGRTLRIVLLPNGAREADWTILGVSLGNAPLEWEWLNHPGEPVP
jgi:hypothetical protein